MQLFAKGSEGGMVSVLKMSAFHFCSKKKTHKPWINLHNYENYVN